MKPSRTVVISGGLGGIGRATARKLSADGFKVVCLYHKTPAKDAESFAASLGSGHKALPCDIRDAESVRKIFEAIEKEIGPVWTGIHAAVDPIVRKNPSEMSAREFSGQFGAALFGGFVFLSETARRLKRRGKGHLIAVTTSALEPGAPHLKMAGYIAAKFALRGLLRELAKEFAGTDIAVHAIAPDFLDTPLNRDLPEKFKEFAARENLRKRLTRPEEVAETIADVLSGKISAGMSTPVGGKSSPL